jgi:outer membrane protein insertion porin family
MIIPRSLRSAVLSLIHWRSKLAAVHLSLLSLLLIADAGHAQQAGKELRLSTIEVTGLERYTREQVLTASGLQLGQLVDIPAIDEAANKLLSSGLFKKLSYRFRSTGNQAVVTFVVEETKETVPVVFDNFVWFTEQELQEAIRREVPTFDGTAPESGEMPDNIKKALQQLLNERKIQGRVEYYSATNGSGKNGRYLFSVKGMKIPICSLAFPGAKDVKESDLLNTSKPLFEQSYSREEVQIFVVYNLIPIYRQRGHLRASFLEPAAKPQTNADCQNGVSVSMQVDEGAIYTWDKAVWSGNTTLSAQELSSALGIKPGERADGLKIDKGIHFISEAYGKKGYIETRVARRPEFDDANRRVTYHYEITEGPLYRMGTVEISGLPEALAQRLKESWKLKTGEVFDTSYYEAFMKKALMEIEAAGLRPQDISVQNKPNRDNRTVNVVINFK